jgi:hypothetical protein
MKTVSNYLFELLKPHISQLICVAETSLEVMLKEYPVFFNSGDVLATSDSPDLFVSATLYSAKAFGPQVLPDIGSLEFRSCSKRPFPTHPSELEVTWLAKPGKETQDILQILKDNFNDFTNSK